MMLLALLIAVALPALTEWESLLEELRSDDVKLNAQKAYRELMWLIHDKPPTRLRGKLERLINDPDYQLRMFATRLLVELYRRQNIPEEEWPEAAMKNLVEGLRDDWMMYRNTFSNAADFFRILSELKVNRPVDLLIEELRGNDPQSRFAAAVLLGRYGVDEVADEVIDELLKHLVDDRMPENGLAAYQALIRMKAENIKRLIERFNPQDWQQAAFVQIAAAYHGIEWSPPERIRERWLEKARSPDKPLEAKLASAALYLDPNGRSFLKGKPMPEILRRTLAMGEGVRDIRDRARWIFTWFPIFDPKLLLKYDPAWWCLLGWPGWF